jgi:hypothetical protein
MSPAHDGDVGLKKPDGPGDTALVSSAVSQIIATRVRFGAVQRTHRIWLKSWSTDGASEDFAIGLEAVHSISIPFGFPNRSEIMLRHFWFC